MTAATRCGKTVAAGTVVMAFVSIGCGAEEPEHGADVEATPELADDVPDISDWDEYYDALADLGAELAVYAAGDTGDGWETIYARAASEPQPVGSIFKLWVLGAVQQAVLDGTASWSDEIEVTDDVRSLPTGDLQEEPEGATFSVAETAVKMISISDNTGTDMLIEYVGREAVEEAIGEMGHGDPQVTSPLLTTRAFFHIGWSDTAVREKWRDADPDARESMIDDVPDGVLDVEPADVTDPVWPYGLEWFASATDIANAHGALQQMAAEDDSDHVKELLAINPGVDIDSEAWPYVAFKGGSSPGVFALSWYAQATEGLGHVLVVQLAAEDADVLSDEDYLVGVIQQGFDLLADP
jgi:beta-lactamase class A